MPIQSAGAGDRSRRLLLPRNLVLLAVAVATVVIGYLVLDGGAPGVASVLLVLGYCVLFPLALLL